MDFRFCPFGPRRMDLRAVAAAVVVVVAEEDEPAAEAADPQEAEAADPQEAEAADPQEAHALAAECQPAAEPLPLVSPAGPRNSRRGDPHKGPA
ncbi:MAG: hypothetical protein ACJ8FY_28135 [Gemmataceae bacterium]